MCKSLNPLRQRLIQLVIMTGVHCLLVYCSVLDRFTFFTAFLPQRSKMTVLFGDVRAVFMFLRRAASFLFFLYLLLNFSSTCCYFTYSACACVETHGAYSSICFCNNFTLAPQFFIDYFATAFCTFHSYCISCS